MAASSHNPYIHSPNRSARSYDSSSVSPSSSPVLSMNAFSELPGQARPATVGYGTGPLPPLPALGAHQQQQPDDGQAFGPAPSHVFGPYTPIAPHSIVRRGSLASTESLMGTPDLSIAHHTAQRSISQKRAYRQRRKDPSCDACRERKVKCDATEMVSCSECSGRNVKCQFTKETNRRMSSIKLVQDLERQLETIRRENSQLRQAMGDTRPEPDPEDSSETLPPQAPGADTGADQPSRRLRAALHQPPVQDLSWARGSVQTYARGIWKPPALYRSRACPRPWAVSGSGQDPRRDARRARAMEPPPRHITDDLLQCYYSCFHTTFPFMHWRSMIANVDELYRIGPRDFSPSWMSLFFAALALGALFSQQHPPPVNQQDDYHQHAAALLETSYGLMDPWSNEFGLDDVRAMTLVTVCLNEMNLRSAAWTWLGKTIRVAQELELDADPARSTNPEDRAWLEAEMGKRLWWTLFVLDCGLAAELGRANMIGDLSVDVTMPSVIDDNGTPATGGGSSGSGSGVVGGLVGSDGPRSDSIFAVVIGVARCSANLSRAVATTAVLSTTRLTMLDQQLWSNMQWFPQVCDPLSSAPLPTSLLPALAYGLQARLRLFRHNLSPSSPLPVRMAALEHCVHVAGDTASLLSRLAGPLPLAQVATTLLTTHIFRSCLLLLLAGCVDHALTCVNALAAINYRRDVAVPCGRFLAFFVAVLAAKRTEYAAAPPTPVPLPSPAPTLLPRLSPTVPHPHEALVHDEELLIYASADLQASELTAWLWGSAPSDCVSLGSDAGPGGLSLEARTGLSPDQMRDWGGWAKLQAAVCALTISEPAPPPPPAPMRRATGPPEPQPEARFGSAGTSGRGRISIASIM